MLAPVVLALLGWFTPLGGPGVSVRIGTSIMQQNSAATASTSASFAEKKEALKDCLRREYASFFQPMETQFYAPNVQFFDPLINLEGVDAYQNNVGMLAGKNPLGSALFSDCGLVMHVIESVSERTLRTRWTLQFRFKLLPWRPLAQFSGVSEYTLDEQARVLRQDDYWDSIDLKKGGGYERAGGTAGLFDMLSQFLPGETAQAASGKELPYRLLRRAEKYEVREYPQHVAVATDYERRVDGLGTLSAYTNGANEIQSDILPYVPSLMAVTKEGSDVSKRMRWPMMVPALERGAPTPPKPTGRLEKVAALEMIPAQIVAVVSFSDPTTEPTCRGYANFLRALCKEDGLGYKDDGVFRLAQFDALNSLKTRRSEVWIELEEHPWKEGK